MHTFHLQHLHGVVEVNCMHDYFHFWRAFSYQYMNMWWPRCVFVLHHQDKAVIAGLSWTHNCIVSHSVLYTAASNGTWSKPLANHKLELCHYYSNDKMAQCTINRKLWEVKTKDTMLLEYWKFSAHWLSILGACPISTDMYSLMALRRCCWGSSRGRILWVGRDTGA